MLKEVTTSTNSIDIISCLRLYVWYAYVLSSFLEPKTNVSSLYESWAGPGLKYLEPEVGVGQDWAGTPRAGRLLA